MVDEYEINARQRGMTPVRVTLAAGVPQRFGINGDYVAGITEPAGVSDLTARFDQSEKVPLPAGLGFRRYYRDVELESATGGAFVVLLGFGSVGDARTTANVTTTVNVAPGNTLPAGGDVVCTAGAATLLSALDATRLSITVSNPSTNSNTMRIGPAGVTASSGYLLEPGESLTLATTAAVYAWNTGVADESVVIGESQEV